MKNGLSAIVMVLAGGMLSHSPFALAQAEIVDLSASDAPAVAVTSEPPVLVGVGNGELFSQLQQLQQEVMQLRGLVEEQAYALKQLQQQRKDDNVSIDRRILALQGGVVAPAASSAAAIVVPKTEVSGDYEKAYKQAYGLLRQNKMDQAVVAFEAYLKDYPATKYTPNAYYWLAELYLLKPDLERSRELFEQLLSQYPNSRKAPDAMFKLGKTYYELGDKAKARQIMQRLLNDYKGQSTPTLKMAQDFLAKNNS